MLNVVEQLKGAMVTCSFPECGTVMPVGKARVMIGGSDIAAIVARCLCSSHDEAARKRSIRTDWLLQQLRHFVQETTETAVADEFFGKFAKKQSRPPEATRPSNGRTRFNPVIRPGNGL